MFAQRNNRGAPAVRVPAVRVPPDCRTFTTGRLARGQAPGCVACAGWRGCGCRRPSGSSCGGATPPVCQPRRRTGTTCGRGTLSPTRRSGAGPCGCSRSSHQPIAQTDSRAGTKRGIRSHRNAVFRQNAEIILSGPKLSWEICNDGGNETNQSKPSRESSTERRFRVAATSNDERQTRDPSRCEDHR